jgi:hypothetical protein
MWEFCLRLCLKYVLTFAGKYSRINLRNKDNKRKVKIKLWKQYKLQNNLVEIVNAGMVQDHLKVILLF